MVRPRKIKTVNFDPRITYFKPQGVPLNELEEVNLTVDELETLRLSNLEKTSQIDAADKMKVHQSTFHRTLVRAREKITDALVNGKAIKIQGGDYTTNKKKDLLMIVGMENENRTEPVSRGRGRMGGLRAAGPAGACVCPECGYRKKHQRAMPCTSIKCPKCKTPMIRG